MAYSGSQQMKKEFRLPMVPGMSCGEEMMRRNYHRSQVIGPRFDCATTFGDAPTDRTAENRAAASAVPSYYGSTQLGVTGAALADSAAGGGVGGAEDLSGRVLRFYAYTIEQVPESALEAERVRQVTMNFYLEDGTMSVTEPKLDNSGIAFRANLKRHIVPKPDGQPITIQDFHIGEPIAFYGRVYLLYDADMFTRDFYAASGSELPIAIEPPADQYMSTRGRVPGRAQGVPSIAAGSVLNTMLTPDQVRATQQFLAHDRKVLRCDCTWDDSESLYGRKHYLTLYYFLSDGSIAVVEKDTQNSGRDPFPNFFRRERIAKPSDPSGKFDSSTRGSLTFKEDRNTVYYTDADIRIGNVLSLYGRKVKIHDYNAYTREHLADLGVTDHTKIRGATPPPFVPPGSVRRELNAEELHVKGKERGEELRRRRFASSVVKFLMRLDNHCYEDEIRRFVVTVYPSDNTISIFEPVIRNSGIVGGKFLHRMQVKSATPDAHVLTSDDFYVGASVVVNAFPFVLLKSDERSLNYMEGNNEEFSHSDINKIVRKMQAMLLSKQTGLAEAFRRADEGTGAGLEMSVLLSIMSELKLSVSEQELLTVLRFFDKNNESYVSYEEVAARILPEGSVVAGDDRSWEAIYEASLQQETASFVTDPQEAAERQRQSAEAEAASRGAQEFMELYDQRRQLFMKEFHAITDYARDSLIGVDEFKMCIRKKLEVDTISDYELNSLCTKLFTKEFPRITFEEFVRIINGTSSLPHTMKKIIERSSK